MTVKMRTANARNALLRRGKPYFNEIVTKRLYLGYRKNQDGGKWVARRYKGGKQYETKTIGTADDQQAADGHEVLDYQQAEAKAKEWARLSLPAKAGAVTVGDAIAAYVIDRESRQATEGVGFRRDARSRLKKHVSEELMNKPLATLTDTDLATWRRGLSSKMTAGAVRRTSNDFRAALNVAAKQHRALLPPTIREVIKDGLAATKASSPVAREAQVISDADVRALIAAAWDVDAEGGWEGDLARLMIVLAAVGARFSQVARMKVGDAQIAQRRLMVPVSRKGDGVKRSSHIAVRVGNDVIAVLAKAIAGRKSHEALLLRPRWKTVKVGAKWAKAGRVAWSAVFEMQRPWLQIVARAGLPSDLIPYCLRHSSIVRGLRAGLPTRLVAALHDTSSVMIEKHYAAYIVDALDELAAKAVVPLTSEPVAPLKVVRT
jgi:integrase